MAGVFFCPKKFFQACYAASMHLLTIIFCAARRACEKDQKNGKSRNGCAARKNPAGIGKISGIFPVFSVETNWILWCKVECHYSRKMNLIRNNIRKRTVKYRKNGKK
ncbi:MAG: hypothetical protein MR295_06680 [Ruminococcus bromii]|nr:hypothetical protein [Ruminococcus bromii]